MIEPPEERGTELRNTIYETRTRSGRRMTRARRIAYSLAVPVGLAILKAWVLSTRIVRVEGAEHLDQALARAPSLVPCYWHQHQLLCARFLLAQRTRAGVGGGAADRRGAQAAYHHRAELAVDRRTDQKADAQSRPPPSCR